MADVRRHPAVEKEVRIAAHPETVFSFFTDLEKMLRWKGIKATLDPRPGGVYYVDMNGKDQASGKYVEILPYSRIVFTWSWEGSHMPPGFTTVEVTFQSDEDDTIIRLRHIDLPEDQRSMHVEGWEHYLARLATAASGGNPGRDPWIPEKTEDN